MYALLILTAVTTAVAISSSFSKQDNCCFANNCLTWSLDGDGRTVRSTCWYKKDQRHWDEVHSVLDLGRCVTNQFGILLPHSSGAFDMSCRDCTVSETMLSCACESPHAAGPMTSSVDLNGFIGSDQGRLSCFGYTASVISSRETSIFDVEYNR